MKHSGVKADAFTNPYIRAQLTGTLAPSLPGIGRTVKQAQKKTNKTEDAFEAYLRRMFPGSDVVAQAMGLRLANGCVYWPDFMVRIGHTNNIRFFETKGRNRAAGTVKIKVAARLYPYWSFHLVTARDRRLIEWDMQEIIS